MKCESYKLFFETLCNETRLDIIEALHEKPLCVSEICEKLGEEQSKISHNLKVLTECHLVTVEQKGKNRIYSLNKETTAPLMILVEKHVSRHCRGKCDRK